MATSSNIRRLSGARRRLVNTFDQVVWRVRQRLESSADAHARGFIEASQDYREIIVEVLAQSQARTAQVRDNVRLLAEIASNGAVDVVTDSARRQADILDRYWVDDVVLGIEWRNQTLGDA